MDKRDQYTYINDQSRKEFARLNNIELYTRPPAHWLDHFLRGFIDVRELEKKLKKFYLDFTRQAQSK